MVQIKVVSLLRMLKDLPVEAIIRNTIPKLNFVLRCTSAHIAMTGLILLLGLGFYIPALSSVETMNLVFVLIIFLLRSVSLQDRSVFACQGILTSRLRSFPVFSVSWVIDNKSGAVYDILKPLCLPPLRYSPHRQRGSD